MDVIGLAILRPSVRWGAGTLAFEAVLLNVLSNLAPGAAAVGIGLAECQYMNKGF